MYPGKCIEHGGDDGVVLVLDVSSHEGVGSPASDSVFEGHVIQPQTYMNHEDRNSRKARRMDFPGCKGLPADRSWNQVEDQS